MVRTCFSYCSDLFVARSIYRLLVTAIADARLGFPFAPNPPVLGKHRVKVVNNALSSHSDQHVPVDAMLGFGVRGKRVFGGEVAGTPVSCETKRNEKVCGDNQTQDKQL